MKRFRDLLKGTILHSKIEVITNEAKVDFLRELCKNDFVHSKNIEKILDRLIPDSIKENEDFFDKGEIYLLLVSIYLHDIGRKANLFSRKKADTFYHEIESYKTIRKKPHKYYLDQFEAEAISQICAAHAKEDVWSIEKNDSNFGIFGLSSSGRTFNLQKLGALLRLCDELDNAYTRIQGISSQTNSVRGIIRDIVPIYEYGRIEIQSSPKNWNEYEALLSVRNYTQQRLEEITKFLKPINLHYYQIWINPDNFNGPININTETPSFQDFILEVGLLLESRNSDIKLSETIDNIQIPILCSEKKTGIETKTAVYSCIDLTKEMAGEISGALSYLKGKNKIDTCLVVTKKIVSDEIKEIFRLKSIHIKDINSLISNLYNFKNAYSFYIKRLSAKEINQKSIFVKPRGFLENGERVEDVEKYINDWTENDKSVQLTILGDFGAGKTTICERIVLEKVKLLNKTDLLESNTRIPILIELKSYTEGVPVESLITNFLVNELNIDINFKEFDTLNKSGKFLIILDGFDEIANLTDEETIVKTFLELDKLVEPNSKIILSCRTHFFKTNDDIHNLHKKGSKLYNAISGKFGYSFLFIEEFNIEQIEIYLKSWDKENYNFYLNLINSIYNLKDLATRPVLLNMIVKTIPQLSKSENVINASILYKTYIRFWLERDGWRTKINVNQRKELAERIADHLYMNDISIIHFKELAEFCKSLNFQQHRFEILDFELRTCNFMKRDVKGNYMFVHKSFQEYILASILFDQLLSKNTIKVKWILPLEKTYSKRSKKIVSEATQMFFLQLMQNEIYYWSSNELINICSNDYNKKNVFANAILELNNKSFGLFFTKYLLYDKIVIEASKILNYVVDSLDFNSCIDYLCDQVPVKGVDYSKMLFRQLSLNGATEKQLKNFEKTILKYDTKVEDEAAQALEVKAVYSKIEEITHLNDNSYPFLKDVYKSRLEDLIKVLEDELKTEKGHISAITGLDEIKKAKADFKRKWMKDKAEYDQKVKNKMKRLK